jgi:asparagine synthase (glutamine-hydrolysing)
MCGIFCLLNYNGQFTNTIIEEDFEKGKHRGPENSILKNIMLKCMFGFHRLAINGLNTVSNQPITINNISLICNGEIYNYKKLSKMLDIDNEMKTDSDCEIIIHMYKKYGIEYTLQMLDGVYSFVLLDGRLNEGKVYVARDPYGVRPLFILKKKRGKVSEMPVLKNVLQEKDYIYGFSSEMKSLTNIHKRVNSKKNKYSIEQFTPGTYSEYSVVLQPVCSWIPEKQNVSYFSFPAPNYAVVTSHETIMKQLRYCFRDAVYKRCETSERPIACLLSGGLDSSLVASLVNEYHKINGLPKLETYSIGVKESDDLKNAKIVADYLGTTHTEIILEEEDFFNHVKDVIKDIESYDTTTVRASIGNWLIGKYISEHSEAKVIFNGDGADELMGGYLYCSMAPDCMEFDKECKRLLKNIHHFDVLRSDRCISSHGLEPRTPFLDRTFTLYYLSLPPEMRWNNMGKKMGKHLIRTAFSKEYTIFDKQLLPTDILYRKKEAFSDGVSQTNRSLYAIMKEYCYEYFLNNEMEIHSEIPMNPDTKYTIACYCDKTMSKVNEYLLPSTAEEYYYRKTFESYYKGNGKVIPYFWMPKYINATDSSARTLNIYDNLEGEKKDRVDEVADSKVTQSKNDEGSINIQ